MNWIFLTIIVVQFSTVKSFKFNHSLKVSFFLYFMLTYIYKEMNCETINLLKIEK